MIRRTFAALAVLTALLLAPAAPALAAGTVTPGAFCANSQIGTTGVSSDGDTYICTKAAGDVRARWHPVGSDYTPTPTATATTPSTPKPTPTSTKTSVTTPHKPGKTSSPPAATLPVTGSKLPYIVGGGVILLALGGGLLAAVRGRRTRFTT